MRSVESSSGGAGEAPRICECYRCDRDVARPFLFRVTVEVPDVLSETYADSERLCCEHCAAAMNLSEFSRRMKTHAERRDEASGG
ncbi:hypothetical protein [Halovivax cerinus]|uniref:Small CPxCG-related zinc finger protein n=1 Tax=Halovivax cerinus TaxID=1487865 RepID=A0ABD5NNW6_9EURY|nr:hypothetical protein [Halovivax cerinus]